VTPEQIVARLMAYRVRTGQEAAFQEDVARVLEREGLREGVDFTREYDLGPGRGRIDFYIPALKLGLELKVKGTVAVVAEQLQRYAGLNGLEQVASVIVFGELDWSPGVHEQAIGRLARDGQRGTVSAYFLVSDEGSDPAVAEVNGLKREQVEGIRNPTDDFIEELQNDGSHARRLAELYLNKHKAPARVEASHERVTRRRLAREDANGRLSEGGRQVGYIRAAP
jgi:hypothetical protein